MLRLARAEDGRAPGIARERSGAHAVAGERRQCGRRDIVSRAGGWRRLRRGAGRHRRPLRRVERAGIMADQCGPHAVRRSGLRRHARGGRNVRRRGHRARRAYGRGAMARDGRQAALAVPAVEPASVGQVPRGHDRRPGLSPYRVCRREARVDRARQRRRALGDERRPASRSDGTGTRHRRGRAACRCRARSVRRGLPRADRLLRPRQRQRAVDTRVVEHCRTGARRALCLCQRRQGRGARSGPCRRRDDLEAGSPVPEAPERATGTWARGRRWRRRRLRAFPFA